MLNIKTIVKESTISGLGLFAIEEIRKGTIVWKYEPLIDIFLDENEITFLSSNSNQNRFKKYLFLDPYYNKYLLCGDDARFFNHSENCNCDDSNKDITIALRNINRGEELTINYNDLLSGTIRNNYKDIKFTPLLQV